MREFEETLEAAYMPRSKVIAHRLSTTDDSLETELMQLIAIAEELDRNEVAGTNSDETKKASEAGYSTCPSVVAPTAGSATSSTETAHKALSKPRSFPVCNLNELVTAIDLRDRLSSISDEFRAHGDYHRIRNDYCQISILLNLEGLWAPAFRSRLKPKAARGNSVYMEIHRDQVVIDCHWLHSMKERVKARDEEFRPLFDHNHEFPFTVAWDFSNKPWKREHRAGMALPLTARQQCQLETLREKFVRDRFESALGGGMKTRGRTPPKISALRQQLGAWGERNKNIIRHLDDYEHLWLARELLGTEGTVRQISELYALIAGIPQKDDKTVSGKLKTLLRHTGGCR